jgi:hypothetical protein
MSSSMIKMEREDGGLMPSAATTASGCGRLRS